MNGKAERTQEAYTRALRMVREIHGNKPPEMTTELELEASRSARRGAIIEVD